MRGRTTPRPSAGRRSTGIPDPESGYDSRGYAQDWQVGVYEEQAPYAPPAASPAAPSGRRLRRLRPWSVPPVDEETVALRLADLPAGLRPEAPRIAGEDDDVRGLGRHRGHRRL